MLTDRILVQLSAERFHPGADGNKCRDPQLNKKHSSESLVEKLGEGLQDLKEIGLPQEDQQGQLSWTLGAP